MKTLIVVRHAKSSWADSNQSDFERPLNDRGKHDAPIMANRIKEKIGHVDDFVSSTALRAQQTCEFFCTAFKFPLNKIQLKDQLYHAEANTIYNVVSNQNQSSNTIAIFGHNPGITDLVNTLVEKTSIDDMPTCGVFAVTALVNDWKEFKNAKKKFLFFDYPKNI